MIEIIKNDFQQASQWTDRILGEVTIDWKDCPPGLKTNINWQIGHLSISTYFHAIACITGPDEAIKAQMSPKKYSLWFGMGTNPKDNLDDKPNKAEMKANLALIDNTCLKILDAMEESDLMSSPLLDNPMGKTKQDILLWTVKHRMWHNGQMALIKSHQS